MSIITRQDGTFVPVREQRTISGTLAAVNAEVVLALSGDESAMIQVNAAGATTSTIVFEGSMDGGVNYFPVLAMPYYALTGTLPVNAQVLITEAFSAVIPFRVYAVATGSLTNLRVRASAFTSGALTVRINSDPSFSIHPNMFARVSTLCVTVTAATGVAATATLPAVTGLRHYIDRIEVTRSATALLTAGAAPTVVTTTNIPGSPAFTFGADAAAQGVDKTVAFDAGATGLAATAIGTATTVVCPLTTGVIWRVNVIYRLGL
jgi:hypothetical protein